MTIIAFDVAKAELVGVAMNKSGNVKERFTVANTPEAIGQFLDQRLTKRITVGSEATAEYHLHLARACLARTVPSYLA